MKKIKEVFFHSKNKKNYVKEWLNKLDPQSRARILNRITRLEYGHYGDYKHIDAKLYELRFFFGKGYRIYFFEEDNKIILLLNAGDKDTQAQDIVKAKQLLQEYLRGN